MILNLLIYGMIQMIILVGYKTFDNSLDFVFIYIVESRGYESIGPSF